MLGVFTLKPEGPHVYVFELGEKIPSGSLAGEPYRISGIYTDSFNEKSRLFALVRALRGGLSVQEVQSGFDPESMVGLGCMIVTANTTNAGKTSSTIASIFKRDNSMPLLIPALDRSKVPDWVRRMQEQRLDKPVANTTA